MSPDALFQPIRLGELALDNRLVMAAMILAETT